MNAYRLSAALVVALAISSTAGAQEPPPAAAVSFASTTPNVRFQAVRVDAVSGAHDGSVAAVGCVAPCGGTLPPGRYAFSLSHDGDAPKVAGQATISGASTVEGTYVSRASTRRAGWITLAAGVAGGLALGALSIHRTVACASPTGAADGASLAGDEGCAPSGHHVDGATLAAGIGVLMVGALVGTWMIRRSDEVGFSVAPVVASAWREGSGQQANVEGLAVRVTF